MSGPWLHPPARRRAVARGGVRIRHAFYLVAFVAGGVIGLHILETALPKIAFEAVQAEGLR